MTRGIVNCNPGNLRLTWDATGRMKSAWQGMCTVQTDSAFVEFEAMKWGTRALAKTLLTYRRKYGLKTVEQIIGRWAPENENDTHAYVADVARRLGVGPDETLDLDSPETLSGLVAAICWHENGVLVAETDINAGVAMALA